MSAPQPTLSKEALITLAANELAEHSSADVFIFNSEIRRPMDDVIIQQCNKLNRRQNVTLILVTEGGDPDAAFRISRCFQEMYENFTCIVPSYCKSAGTLVVIGANELVVCNAGELGPLDIQMAKKDEIAEFQSGLTVMASLKALHEKSFSAFEHFFLTIKKKSRGTITLRTATEISAKLTAGLFAPIFQQIDPMHVGEAFRATAISREYGRRLNIGSHNLSEQALDWLIAGYPTHGFVIDRNEATALFENVRGPNATEANLIAILDEAASTPLDGSAAIRKHLSDEQKENANDDAAENPEHPLQLGGDEQPPENPRRDAGRGDAREATAGD
jgi:hypothetical protein